MSEDNATNRLGKFISVFRYSRVALQLVWSTSAVLTLVMGLSTLVAGILPAAIASVGGYIVDAVVSALNASGAEQDPARMQVLYLVLLEAGLVLLISAAQRINTVCQSILRVLLGNRINVMILEKSLTLELAHFEDSEFYDKLTRARREASSRPLSLVIKTFDLIRNMISLLTIAVFLFRFSPLAVLLLIGAGIPAFVAEARFSGEAFRIYRRRSAERRRRMTACPSSTGSGQTVSAALYRYLSSHLQGRPQPGFASRLLGFCAGPDSQCGILFCLWLGGLCRNSRHDQYRSDDHVHRPVQARPKCRNGQP